jgi:integrin alpha FG-GAP repeat containing protein 1
MKSNGTKLNVPHSHAFVDLNEDFSADLYLTTEEKSAEIWEFSSNHDFVYNRTISYNPPGSDNHHYGQTIFMDMELNGHLNMLIPVCHDKECKNSTIWVQSGEHYRDLNINFVQDEKNIWGFLKPSGEFYAQTITLRAGDFNNDGFPDLLATLQKNSGAVIQTFLLENVKNIDAKPSDHFKRTFQVQWKALVPFEENTVMGSFYDFYQDGILDVILLKKDGDKFKPLAFRNTLDYDANFVKVIVLTGLKNKKPPAKETPFGQKRRNYGTNLPGPRIKYQTTTQEGVPQHGGSCQLPQSAYMSLHLPYTIFGLGRTPNFVDSIDVGLGGHKRRFPQIIPNSQIFVIPAPITKPNEWKMQLFVTPSKIIIKSVFALLGICLIILLIILGLHIKERREDKLEKLQEAQRFHFDAM